MPRQPSPKYTPRWLYSFFALLDRLPIRGWTLAALVFLLGTLAMHVDAWRQALLATGQLNTYLTTVTLYIVAYPGLWLILDQRARIALKEFLKGKSNANFEAVYTDFISLPTLPATLVFILGSLLGLNFFLTVQETLPLVGRVLPAWDFISWVPITGLMFMLLYRTIRQAVLMPRLFNQIQVSLFDPSPVYALSRYASQASVGLLIINFALIYASIPSLLFSPAAVVYYVLILGGSLLYFFGPLASINNRMRREKERLLAEIGRDLEDVYKRVHTSVKTAKFRHVDEIRNSIPALKDQLEIVRKSSTWPWQPETLRNLITPMLIPVVVYLVQRYLGSIFGF